METRDKAKLRKWRRRQVEKLQENHRDLVFDWMGRRGEKEAKDNTLI